MNLSKTIRSFFATVIVGIEVDNKSCIIASKFYKNGKNIDTQTKEFKTIPGELPAQAVRYVKKIRTKNPFTYISTLSSSIIQGAIHNEKEVEFEKYGINPNEIVQKNQNSWLVYVSKDGIAETKKRFLKLGADFIISPFMVLYYLSKNIFQDSCKLYILFQRSNITMIVTNKNEGVLFGGYYVLDSEIDSELKVVENTYNFDDEDDLSSGIQDELSDVDGIDFSHNGSDEELIEVLKGDDSDFDSSDESSGEDNSGDDLNDYARVTTASKFIQTALNEFYNNELYKSEFINDIVVFNPHNIEEETLKQIENITMLEVRIEECNISEVLANLGYESYKYFDEKGQV
ncbi:hypothetical protein [Helicobacter ibis]|uniref:Uncharacterized protein n=1 Tax=Helicobacter ibis TaxID=2962633 RepID=A0ABT4VHH5_9HELI|nr:hypothetical protein [Helicobacter ibis]MDA3969580.1 hypothetical protein [Helicobacter ibis]